MGGKSKTNNNNKMNIKDRIVDDDTIDLSLSDISEIPIDSIAEYKRITILDLSSNKIGALGKTFSTTLSHLTQLDLSKNNLKLLPENFGKLINLKHLDLYSNGLQHLPLSFSNLKKLRYLDLKDNPLTPSLARYVGKCITQKDCQQSAINTVQCLADMQLIFNEELKNKETLRKQQQQKAKELAANDPFWAVNDAAASDHTDNKKVIVTNIAQTSINGSLKKKETNKDGKQLKKLKKKNEAENKNKSIGGGGASNDELHGYNLKYLCRNIMSTLFVYFLIFSILLVILGIFIVRDPEYSDELIRKSMAPDYQSVSLEYVQKFRTIASEFVGWYKK